MGQGEPLNIIISGNSDSRVLVDSPSDGGLQNYFQCALLSIMCINGCHNLFISFIFRSLGFSGECLGQRESVHQAANLGDGHDFSTCVLNTVEILFGSNAIDKRMKLPLSGGITVIQS